MALAGRLYICNSSKIKIALYNKPPAPCTRQAAQTTSTVMDAVKEKIRLAYDELAEKYNELIEHKPHNAYYDRPNTLLLLPDVKGKNILDAACGPGKYAQLLMAQGANVTGFDISQQMVRLAQQRNQGKGHFFVHDLAAPFTMLPNQRFDIVLCALALHYVQHWPPTIQEFCRVLKPGGQLILSIEHPFFEYNYFNSDKYFEVEHVKCTWRGFGKPVQINSYRRPLQQCLQPLTSNGFYIDELTEPRPVKEFEQLDPKHYKELNAFPGFMCIRAVKR
jgi:ubiquinone/menaquinone biosynthesis C-methylase UbiE